MNKSLVQSCGNSVLVLLASSLLPHLVFAQNVAENIHPSARFAWSDRPVSEPLPVQWPWLVLQPTWKILRSQPKRLKMQKSLKLQQDTCR